MSRAIVGILVIVAGLAIVAYVLRGNNALKSFVRTPTGQPTSTPTTTPPGTTPGLFDISGGPTSMGTSSASTAPGTKGGMPVAASSVTFSDAGFSPAAIIVKKGTTVTFTNQSNASMWVASDVHPTHQLLPGFDSKRAIIKGSSYEYTFMRVGTWPYHNHNNPNQTGTVVVTE